MSEPFALFAGSSNSDLAAAVARELALPLVARVVERFPDGETFVRLEQPVRGHQVFIIQPTGPPVNDNLVELLSFVDACRRAAAANIIAVVPYFGYARQDKRHGHREPVTASMGRCRLRGLYSGAFLVKCLTASTHEFAPYCKQ